MQKFKCNKNHLVLRIANNTTIALRKKRIKREVRWSFSMIFSMIIWSPNKQTFVWGERTLQRWRWELCLDLLFNLDSGGKALIPVLGSRQHRCWSHREVAPGAVAGRVKEYQQVEICDKWKSESRKWSSDDWYYFLLLVHDMAHLVTFFLLAHLVTYLVNSWPPAFIFTGHGLARLGL